MVQPRRRTLVRGAAAAFGAMAVAPQLLAQSGPVRVGYAISRTGP
jgi:branched-chain amino acid transport system substrate-binding protein